MITKEMTHITHQATRGIPRLRLLGTLGLLGSPMLLTEGFYAGFEPHGTDQFVGLLGAIYVAGWMSSIVGLGITEATGRRWLGKAVLGIQFIGLILAAVWSAIHIMVLNPNTDQLLYQIGDAAWPLSHLFMIVVGIVVLVAKTRAGWAKFTPLLCGLALPVAILAGVVAGEEVMGLIFPIWTTVAFASLGYTVYTSNRT